MDSLARAADLLDRDADGEGREEPLAQMTARLDPTTVQTPALDLLDRKLAAVAGGHIQRLIWSMPPQEGKPVILDAMILMGDGSRRRLEDVEVGDAVITHRGRPRTVTAVHEQGNLPVVKITTHAGRIVTTALDHPFLTPSGWVNAGDLTKGDVLAVVSTPRTNSTDTLTPEAARLLGYFIGDGNTTASTSNLNAAITSVDGIESDDIAHCADTLGFGVTRHPKVLQLSTGVRPWLRHHGLAGCTSWTKRVPVEVFTQSPTLIAEFIGAYFACDGTVSRRGGARPDARVEFNSVSRDLLADVQHLLLRLGICTTVRAKNTKFNGKPYVSWRLLMRRQDDVGKFRDLVPIHHAKAAVLADWPLRRTAFDAPLLPDEIESIERRAEAECRCLTVDEDHTFTADDLVVHNSERVSRRFPAWMLRRNPDLRVAIASYEQRVATRWGRAIRNDLVEHPSLGLSVRRDTSAAHEWQLDGHRGGVYSVGIGGALTGRPVELLIIDDPVKGRAEADSEVYREACWDWWTNVARTRLAPNAPVVLILTRWHEDDLAGRLISVGGWDVVNIPAQAEANDPLGRQVGEYLTSARGRTPEQWQAIEHDVGARVWTALYQGHPSPAEGALLKRGWWRYYPAPMWREQPDGSMLVHDVDQVIASWDMTFKDTKASDYVVGGVWAMRGANAYLLDVVRDRMDFPTTCRAVQALASKWPQAHAKLVEDKANGSAVIAQLRSVVYGLVPITPTESKEARASAVSPYVEAGNVWLPDPSLAPWVARFVEECSAFPHGTHDDQVDMATQALARLMLTGGGTRLRFIA